MHTPRSTARGPRVIGGRWGVVVVRAAWGARPAACEEGRGGRLRQSMVRVLQIAAGPRGGVVQVLAASVGLVVGPGLALIEVVRGTDGRRSGGDMRAI